jgi:hypothetical protein
MARGFFALRLGSERETRALANDFASRVRLPSPAAVFPAAGEGKSLPLKRTLALLGDYF